METVTLFASNVADDEITLKCLVLGEQNVGKTSILNTLIDNAFDSQSAPTIGIDFRVLRAAVECDHRQDSTLTALLEDQQDASYKLQIWDSAGQYRFRSIVSSYFRLAHIFIIVFDLTDRESFMYVREWRKSIDEQRQTSAFLVYLIGNKCDETKKQVITSAEAKTLSYELNFDGYFEVSAKSKTGITAAFKTIISDTHIAIKKNVFSEAVRAQMKVSDGVDLKRATVPRNFLSSCCS